MPHVNDLNQPIGHPMPDGWAAPPSPPRRSLSGRYARIEPLNAAMHTAALWAGAKLDHTGESWTYMVCGPFADQADFGGWITAASATDDPLFFAFVDQATDQAIGLGSFMRIDPAAGVVEVGGIWMSPLLQRTCMATEVMHLMMKQAFDLGYRRYEWKCDALNQPSHNAALRLGFTFEGVFRQATHYKGRSRDTAWFSVIDAEWPAIAAAQTAWLDPGNFDQQGRQKQSLSDLISR